MRPLSLLILTSIHTASSTPLYNTVFDSPPVRSRIVNARANLVPSGWDYLGCYADSGTRLLPIHLTSGNAMTRPSCLASCAAAGYIAGGVEFGDECWCSASRPAGTPLAESYCNMACTGPNSFDQTIAVTDLSLPQGTLRPHVVLPGVSTSMLERPVPPTSGAFPIPVLQGLFPSTLSHHLP